MWGAVSVGQNKGCRLGSSAPWEQAHFLAPLPIDLGADDLVYEPQCSPNSSEIRKEVVKGQLLRYHNKRNRYLLHSLTLAMTFVCLVPCTQP